MLFLEVLTGLMSALIGAYLGYRLAVLRETRSQTRTLEEQKIRLLMDIYHDLHDLYKRYEKAASLGYPIGTQAQVPIRKSSWLNNIDPNVRFSLSLNLRHYLDLVYIKLEDTRLTSRIANEISYVLRLLLIEARITVINSELSPHSPFRIRDVQIFRKTRVHMANIYLENSKLMIRDEITVQLHPHTSCKTVTAQIHVYGELAKALDTILMKEIPHLPFPGIDFEESTDNIEKVDHVLHNKVGIPLEDSYHEFMALGWFMYLLRIIAILVLLGSILSSSLALAMIISIIPLILLKTALRIKLVRHRKIPRGFIDIT